MGWRRAEGKSEVNRKPTARRVLRPDLAAVGLDDSAGNRQAQAQTTAGSVLASVELVEDLRRLICGDASAVVDHGHNRFAIADRDVDLDSLFAEGVFEGVVDEVEQYLLD